MHRTPLARALRATALAALTTAALAPAAGAAPSLRHLTVNPTTQNDQLSLSSANAATIGSTTYFSATMTGGSPALFATTGGAAATLVQAFPTQPGSNPANLDDFTVAGGKLFFVTTTADSGRELWVSDGTAAGTHLVRDIYPGTGNSSPQYLTAFNDKVYFTAASGSNRMLWSSDGSSGGTAPVITTPATGASDSEVAATNGHLFFIESSSTGSNRLQQLDASGTSATPVTLDGATMTADTLTASPGGKLYFNGSVSGNRSLYDTDGTADPVQVTENDNPVYDFGDWTPVPTSTGVAFIRDNDYEVVTRVVGETATDVTATDNNLSSLTAFPATDGTTTLVYSESGNSAGGSSFYSVKAGQATPTTIGDISDTTQDEPWSVQAVGHGVVFTEPSKTTIGLYRTGGEAGDITRIGDAGDTNNQYTDIDRNETIAPAGSGALFIGGDPLHGLEPAYTDGTAAGTHTLGDLNSALNDAQLYSSTVTIGGKLYFSATDGTHGDELWTTDGTVSGTHMVTDLVAGADSSYPQYLVTMGGKLYFVAYGDNDTGSLYVSDGTAAGTHRVSATDDPNAQYPGNLTVVGSTLFYQASTSGGYSRLWRTDGSSAGTAVDVPVPADTAYRYDRYGVSAGGKLFEFSQTRSTTSDWRYTAAVVDQNGNATALPGNHTFSVNAPPQAVGSKVYFDSYENGAHHPWVTNGTDTVELQSGGAPAVIDYSQGFTALGDGVAFTGNDPSTGDSLLYRADAAGVVTQVATPDLNPGSQNGSGMTVT